MISVRICWSQQRRAHSQLTNSPTTTCCYSRIPRGGNNWPDKVTANEPVDQPDSPNWSSGLFPPSSDALAHPGHCRLGQCQNDLSPLSCRLCQHLFMQLKFLQDPGKELKEIGGSCPFSLRTLVLGASLRADILCGA